jgi:hypothetical protein
MSISYVSPEYSHKILEHFGEACIRSKTRLDHIDIRDLIFICFTNRSGSNTISEDISHSFEYQPLGEILSPVQVLKKSKINGYKSYEEYLHFTLKKYAGQKLLIKISVDQLIFLHKYKFLNNFFNNPKYIHVSRRDLLSQAISYYIAINTLQWNVSQKPKAPIPPFNLEKIINLTQNFSFQNSKFAAFFCLCSIKPFQISYENYLKNSEIIFERLSGFLKIQNFQKITSQKKFLRQESKEKVLYRSYVLDYFNL